jgi:putative CocE/NonD family hydrolase
MGLAAMGHPAHAAAVPMAQGAGIGRMGPFYEQGNFFRGGAVQLPMVSWLNSTQNTQRPTLPRDLSREDRIRLATYFDLAPSIPSPDWDAAFAHLPLVGFMENVGGPKGVFSEMVKRTPDDPAWYEGGLYHDDEDFGVPALWINSWYDVSIGPNLALYNHVRASASDPQVRDNQYMVIAPTLHCRFFRPSWELEVGEREMGDASFDYEGLIFSWFDAWLKRGDGVMPEETPRVQYYAMGVNEWRFADEWPPAGAVTHTLYLSSAGAAQSLFGDGALIGEPPADDRPDRFVSDPSVPVPSLGGGICCIGGTIEGGSFDQRPNEARADVLVYTSEPLGEALEVTGPVKVRLFVSSDARDTDFMVKLVDVDPDGRAFNLDETAYRARYREGYDREVWMEPGSIYEIEFSAMATSNAFLPGHRIRLEVASSNFPRFARNLNTGGPNYSESEGVVARNAVHHSLAYPSRIELTVVPPKGAR